MRLSLKGSHVVVFKALKINACMYMMKFVIVSIFSANNLPKLFSLHLVFVHYPFA